MNLLVLAAVAVSGVLPFLLVRGRVRRAPAWAFGGVVVYLLVWSGMRFGIEVAQGRELYGLSALSEAVHKGDITVEVFERERERTRHAFAACLFGGVAAAAGYGVILRLSSKPKSA